MTTYTKHVVQIIALNLIIVVTIILKTLTHMKRLKREGISIIVFIQLLKETVNYRLWKL